MDEDNHGHFRFAASLPAPQFTPISRFAESKYRRAAIPDPIPSGGRIIVDILEGQRWRCLNQECRSEILVSTSSLAQGGSNPRCSCGEIMKKPYFQPELYKFESKMEAHRSFEESPS